MPKPTNLKGREYLESIPLPSRLEKLEKDERGYIIPYFVPRDTSGKPDFKFMDGRKQVICAVNKICMICGQKLEPENFWYILGPLARKQRTSSDPAMHEECARYSLQACPHMHYKKAQRTTDPTIDADIISRHKPDVMYLVQAKKYYLVQNKHYLLSEYRDVVHEEQYVYEKNLLVKNENFFSFSNPPKSSAHDQQS